MQLLCSRTCSPSHALVWVRIELRAFAFTRHPASPRPHAANEENAALRKAIEDADYECGVGLLRLTVGSSGGAPAELPTSRWGGRLNVLRLPRDSVCVRSRGSGATSQVGSSRLDHRVPPCHRRRRLAQVRDDGEIEPATGPVSPPPCWQTTHACRVRVRVASARAGSVLSEPI